MIDALSVYMFLNYQGSIKLHGILETNGVYTHIFDAYILYVYAYDTQYQCQFSMITALSSSLLYVSNRVYTHMYDVYRSVYDTYTSYVYPA